MKNRRIILNKIPLGSSEFDTMLNKISSIDDLLNMTIPLFSKPSNSLLKFKQRISYLYDENERSDFYLLLDRHLFGIRYCMYCNRALSLNAFTVQAFGTDVAWRTYCESQECFKASYTKRVIKDPAARNKKISDARKNFFSTDHGKAIAKEIGQQNKNRLTHFYSTESGKIAAKEIGKKISESHKRDIAAGKWTPGVHNRWTNWDASIEINGKLYKFRSSWEACFWASNQTLEYETFRCKYVDSSGVERTYIGDFFDSSSNTLYEIKPSAIVLKEMSKISQVIDFCLANRIKFKLINESNISDFLNIPFLLSSEDTRKQLMKVVKNVKFIRDC